MTPNDLAQELGIDPKQIRRFLRQAFPRLGSEKYTPWLLTSEQTHATQEHFRGRRRVPRAVVPDTSNRSDTRSVRDNSDEAYVISLCDEVLGETGSRQHRFDWLRGDANASGQCAYLPVDAYYARHGLVIEYHERQHDGAAPFFNRRATLSGVDRGEQRRMYDERREFEIPRHGLRLIIIKSWNLDQTSRGRLLRTNHAADLANIRRLLS